MKLLVKFNLMFLLVMMLGLGVSAMVARDLLQANAREDVLNNARLLMEKANAVRNYTSNQVTGLLQTQMKYEFLPQAIPSYSAVEVMGSLQKSYPEFIYKEATLNPTNPRDRATGFEVDIVSGFRGNAENKELVGQRDTPTGPSLFIARPLRITNAACLECHTSVETAPRTLVAKYGPANGFGWNLNEVIGAQIVSVPMTLPLQRAERSLRVFMASQIGVFAAVGIMLNLMIWLTIVRPVTRLSMLADQVSQGNLNAPEFESRSKDEIGTLTMAFSRMRKSVVQAIRMLDT
jgi:HAMP domain-containing protein